MNALDLLANRFHDDGRGVTSIEYALIALQVALLVIVGATAIGTHLNTTFSSVAIHI